MHEVSSPISVTGLGLISPLGNEIDAFWQSLLAGRSAVHRLAIPGTTDIPAATVSFDPGQWLTKLQMVGTDRVSQMALGAARMAMKDAGFERWSDPHRAGLYVGTGMAGASSMDLAYSALYEGRRIPPLTVPASMVNAPAAVVAIHTDTQGPVMTHAVACASSAVALAEAAHALRRGEIDVALVGGAEGLLVKGTVIAWQALGALAPIAADPTRSCRPYSSDRSGLVMGEGASFLVLEREPDANARGRASYARLASSAIRCDAVHLTKPQVRGQVAAIRAAISSAGLSPDDISYCNPHGTGTPAGDPVECESLRAVWGERSSVLQVGATKASHGHLLGGAGSLEALITVLALARSEVPPTAGVSAIDPACAGLDHVLSEGRSVPSLRHAISTSFAFGGTNVALVFSRV